MYIEGEEAFKTEFIQRMGAILGLNVPSRPKTNDGKLVETLAGVVQEIDRLRKLVESYSRLVDAPPLPHPEDLAKTDGSAKSVELAARPQALSMTEHRATGS